MVWYAVKNIVLSKRKLAWYAKVNLSKVNLLEWKRMHMHTIDLSMCKNKDKKARPYDLLSLYLKHRYKVPMGRSQTNYQIIHPFAISVRLTVFCNAIN